PSYSQNRNFMNHLKAFNSCAPRLDKPQNLSPVRLDKENVPALKAHTSSQKALGNENKPAPKLVKPPKSLCRSQAAELGQITSRVHHMARDYHCKTLLKPPSGNINPVFFLPSNYILFSTQIEQFMRIYKGPAADHDKLQEALKEISESDYMLLVPILDSQEEI